MSIRQEPKNFYENVPVTMTEPTVGNPLPTDARTGNNANTEVTKVVWTGQSDNGRAIAGVTNPVTISVRIKPGANAKFTTGTISSYVNGSNILMSTKRLSDSEAEITFVFPALGITFPGMKSGFTATAYKSQTCIAEQIKRNLAEKVVSDTFSEAPSYAAPYAAGKLGRGGSVRDDQRVFRQALRYERQILQNSHRSPRKEQLLQRFRLGLSNGAPWT